MSLERQVDFEVIQMMCSRLCHDLVGTVGAINAAIELIADESSGDIDSDVHDLLASSAGEASRKLAFYRAAFGLGGNHATLIDFHTVQDLVEGLMGGGNSKVSFKWIADTTTPIPNIAAKLIYMITFLSFEALPRGGQISVHVQPFDEGLGLACAAEGAGAALRDAVVRTLEGNTSSNDLSSREVHAYYAKILAETADAKIELGTGESLINFAVLIPFSSLS
ncbi:MAG: hypothetical protein HON65_14160 [Rhodospirillales bacterium]|jgi:histidine phosphotransferase ChpT|nr:hypothetical protein [Rhodospirillales bacterium]